MFNLKKEIKEYLNLNEDQIESLFKKIKSYKLHIAYSMTLKEFKDTGTLEEKRKFFKSYL